MKGSGRKGKQEGIHLGGAIRVIEIKPERLGNKNECKNDGGENDKTMQEQKHTHAHTHTHTQEQCHSLFSFLWKIFFQPERATKIGRHYLSVCCEHKTTDKHPLTPLSYIKYNYRADNGWH